MIWLFRNSTKFSQLRCILIPENLWNSFLIHCYFFSAFSTFNQKSSYGLQNERFKSPVTRDFPEHPESGRSQILKENSKHLEKQNLAQLGSRKEFYLRENEVKMARSTGVGIGDERLESELIKFYTIKKKGQINKNICWSKFFFYSHLKFCRVKNWRKSRTSSKSDR